MKRRTVIKKGVLAGAGAAILPPVAGAATGQPVALPLATYSDNVLPKATSEGVHILVSIDNMKAFTDQAVRAEAFPYDNITAGGNVLSFTHGGTSYKVENVLPQHFTARAGEL